MVLGLDRGCNKEWSGGVEQRVRDIAAGGLVERIELGVEDKKTRTLPSQSNRDVLRLDVDKGEAKYWEMAYEGVKARPGKVVVESNELAEKAAEETT